ncbi:MAG: hypothetical protein HZB39_12175 [Planctomycetes bacterium]|nr:hypothetical protein [Planctomycetota bacterium]
MNESNPEAGAPQGGPHHHEFQIQIDRVHYTVAQERMTGSEIRRVPPTPIGPERDLFEVVPGHPDNKVDDNEVIEIRNGKRFFTAPGTINPGSVSIHLRTSAER